MNFWRCFSTYAHTPEQKSSKDSHIFHHLTVSSHGRKIVNSVPSSCGPITMNSALQALYNSGFITEILSLVLTQFKPL